MPKSFFNSVVSRLLLTQAKKPAQMQPAIIAGKIFLISSAPWRQRNRDAIIAEGIKNSRFIIRAAGYSVPTTRVSQSIRRLPPPTPRPDKNPNKMPTDKMIGQLSSINIAPRPIIQESPTICEAIRLESFCPIFRQEYPLQNCQSDKLLFVPMRWRRVDK